MVCQIFEVLDAAWKLGGEVERLVPEIESSLTRAGLKIESEKSSWDESKVGGDTGEWFQRGSTRVIYLNLREAGKRGKSRIRALSFRVEMHRDQDEETRWPHARSALLIVGFWGDANGNWENDELVTTAHGRLADGDAWSCCTNQRHAESKLLEWLDPDEVANSNWSQRCWVFAIPMKVLTNSSKVDSQVATPVRMLMDNAGPDKALAGVDAVVWGD